MNLFGLEFVDGFQLAEGQRVLCTGQRNSRKNGVWIANRDAWTRSEDCSEGVSCSGMTCFVEQGTEFSNTMWTCVNESNVRVGDPDIRWVQFTARPLTYFAPPSDDSAVTKEYVDRMALEQEPSKTSWDILREPDATENVWDRIDELGEKS